MNVNNRFCFNEVERHKLPYCFKTSKLYGLDVCTVKCDNDACGFKDSKIICKGLRIENKNIKRETVFERLIN